MTHRELMSYPLCAQHSSPMNWTKATSMPKKLLQCDGTPDKTLYNKLISGEERKNRNSSPTSGSHNEKKLVYEDVDSVELKIERVWPLVVQTLHHRLLWYEQSR